MTNIPDIPGPESKPANRFTPDAQERMTRLRAMAAEFPDEADPKPLTIAEIRLARSTSVTALEKAALIIDAAPLVANAIAIDPVALREAIAFEMAYGGVLDEARSLARRIDLAILRRKLKVVKEARGLYRVAKSYVTVDAGDAVRPHVTEMQRSLKTKRRRKPAPSAPSPETPIAAQQ